MSLTFDEKLSNYASLLIHVGVNLQKGQRLLLRAPITAAPLVRKVVAEAYKQGSPFVDVHWDDEELTKLRFEHAPADSFEEQAKWRFDASMEGVERGDALLTIRAQDPDLLKGQNPEHVSTAIRSTQTLFKPFSEHITAHSISWCLVAYPVESWAKKVFADESADTAIELLWDAIFATTRADQANAVELWKQHQIDLAARAKVLNDKHYAALHFKNATTDLTVGLPDGHIWHGGGAVNRAGQDFVPNMPTEEVFTLPDKDQVDGLVRSSKPLSYNGNLIDNFELTFEKGKVVSYKAEVGEDTLKNLLESDEGASRLGEVALVPNSSPVSQSNILFYHTLFDENAASHIALGQAYSFTVKGGEGAAPDEFAKLGANSSLVHVDFMIGSADMDVDGVFADGSREPLMRSGEWTS